MKCAYCGNGFSNIDRFGRTLPQTKFCSRKCQNAASRERCKANRSVYICQHCGRPFQPKADDRTKYCSRECCFAEWHSKCRTVVACQLRYCRICGKAIAGKKRLCSRECQMEDARRLQRARDERQHVAQVRRCAWCGKEFVPEYGNKRRVYCSASCLRKASRANGRPAQRVARHAQLSRRNARIAARPRGSAITLLRVFERDSGRCQLCGKRVDLARKFPDMQSASIDHVIPIASGGAHDWWNVQLAHLGCNSKKRDTVWNGGEQLRLDVASDVVRGTSKR